MHKKRIPVYYCLFKMQIQKSMTLPCLLIVKKLLISAFMRPNLLTIWRVFYRKCLNRTSHLNQQQIFPHAIIAHTRCCVIFNPNRSLDFCSYSLICVPDWVTIHRRHSGLWWEEAGHEMVHREAERSRKVSVRR